MMTFAVSDPLHAADAAVARSVLPRGGYAVR